MLPLLQCHLAGQMLHYKQLLSLLLHVACVVVRAVPWTAAKQLQSLLQPAACGALKVPAGLCLSPPTASS